MINCIFFAGILIEFFNNFVVAITRLYDSVSSMDSFFFFCYLAMYFFLYQFLFSFPFVSLFHTFFNTSCYFCLGYFFFPIMLGFVDLKLLSLSAYHTSICFVLFVFQIALQSFCGDIALFYTGHSSLSLFSGNTQAIENWM